MNAGGTKAPPGSGVLPLSGCLYLVLFGGGWFWLWQRQRLEAVPAMALGEHGLYASAAAGLSCGLLGAVLLGLLARRLTAVGRCEQRLAGLIGPLREHQIQVLAMLSAIAEEWFFRLAMQDALGMPIAVAIYGGLSTGPGLWAWAPVAGGAAAVFGGLVAGGFGLLSATVAHAVITYLSLRRILPS